MIEIAPSPPPAHHDVGPVTRKGTEKRGEIPRTDTVDAAGKHPGPHLEPEERGEASPRPSHRRNSFRIGCALINRPLDRVEQILLGSTSPFPSPGVQKLQAKAGRTAIIHLKHAITTVRQQLHLRIEIEVV